jgi:hypothetical protein
MAAENATMQSLEKDAGTILGAGIIAWIVGWRLYGLYAGVRESQRNDVAVSSGVQTLFTEEPLCHNATDDSGIQTLFSSEEESN